MIRLGKKAKDIITGFEGIITSKAWYLNGSERYGITPQCTDAGKPAEVHYFDVQQVQNTASDPVVNPVSSPAADENHLGERANDTITGFTGIATAKAVYLNGCVHYLVEAKMKGDKFEEGQWFDANRLEFKPAKNNTYKVAKTGGPQRYNPPAL